MTKAKIWNEHEYESRKIKDQTKERNKEFASLILKIGFLSQFNKFALYLYLCDYRWIARSIGLYIYI